MNRLVLLAILLCPIPLRASEPDILVFGGTPAGIAAARAAGQKGRSVVLAEPYSRIGGLVTNGLSHTDFRTFEGITGTYLELSQRAQKYYAKKYSPDSPQAKGCFRGTHAEPHVNQLLFEQMLDELPKVAFRTRYRLNSVKTNGRRITSVTFDTPEGQRTFEPKMVIDASYEGDLMARAGVKFRVGREASNEYREPLAPEKADRQVQGYNFRFVMRNDAARVLPKKPKGYRREDFVPVLKLLGTERVKSVFCRSTGGIYKAHRPMLPNGKYDVNDVSRAPVRLSLPDINDTWPTKPETRRQLFEEHLLHNVGLLYFLQNDDAVPKQFRDEARAWGWCPDEFPDTGNIPEQLYIREARRMVGQHVFTERDTDHAPGDARAVLHKDSIAMGDYGPNCHGTAHTGSRFGDRHTGEFYKRVPPYQIPYGVIVPKEFDNLLVPVACSASHVGFCALRLEPIWTSLGQAAGFAASLALTVNKPVQRIPVARLQHTLHAHGAATIYTADVPVDLKSFRAVQWWGTHGGLHGLASAPKEPGQRGAHILGQYYQAFPGHEVGLDKPLSPALRRRWLNLIREFELDADALSKTRTRGEFIRLAYSLRYPDP